MEKLSLVGALALFGAMNAQKSSEATSKGDVYKRQAFDGRNTMV